MEVEMRTVYSPAIASYRVKFKNFLTQFGTQYLLLPLKKTMDLLGSDSVSSASCYSDDGSSSNTSLCDCGMCNSRDLEVYAGRNVCEPRIARQSFNPIHRLVKWSLPPPPAMGAPLPGWGPMPFGLETFWQSAFAWFFRPFLADHGHIWTLEPTDVPPMSVEWPWHSVVYSAKVRFLCPKERHGWTSMKGRVNFWFRMRRQGSEILCEALFRLFGQECSRCQQFDDMKEFVNPLWYPEEIENAFRLLSTEVSRAYYGGLAKDAGTIKRIRGSNRSLMSTNHHDPARCQACYENQCNYNVLKH